MEAFTKLLTWLKSLPVWAKSISLLVIALISAVLLFTSCGVTRAVVTNRAEGTTTTISITTNNPTEVNTTPDVDLSVKPSDTI